jgi:menaquinone-9 beta-reductase
METKEIFDCAIIGGGLGGLCLAIQLADKNRRVILFEKNEYPFQRVCGEYISMESWDFLVSLGLPLARMNLPIINQLGISSEKGFMMNSDLKLGGFGISRLTLDNELYKIAISKNVVVLQNCKVTSVTNGTISEIITSNATYAAKIICGAFGKYTPTFAQNVNKISLRTNGVNYIGVKYHIKSNLNNNRIELHNFKAGYCGISRVDNDHYCLCYLTNADNLKDSGGKIDVMEKQILYKNPFLKKYFTESDFVNPTPLVVSNVQFSSKQTNVNGIFLLGDAAGSITPLCGNGMSMAMRSSKILAQLLESYFDTAITMNQLISEYDRLWRKNFKTRITAGFYLLNLFGKNITTHLSLKLLNNFPRITQKLISLTHGEIF